MADSDTTDLARTLELLIQNQVATHKNEDLEKVCEPIVSTDDVVKVQNLVGGNNYTAVSGYSKPSNTAFRAITASSSPTPYEVNVKLTQDQIDQLGGLAAAVKHVVPTLTQQALDKIAIDYWAFIAGAAAIAHPLSGSGDGLAATGGGTAYVADEHTITPINGGSTRAIKNFHALSLTASNVRTVLNEHAEYFNLAGESSVPKGPLPYLFCVTALQGVAKNLVAQRGQQFNGAGLQEGFADEIAGAIVLPPESTSSSTLWGLIWRPNQIDPETGGQAQGKGPVMAHICRLPKADIQKEPGGNFTNFYCEFKADAAFPHPEVHRDLHLCEP